MNLPMLILFECCMRFWTEVITSCSVAVNMTAENTMIPSGSSRCLPVCIYVVSVVEAEGGWRMEDGM